MAFSRALWRAKNRASIRAYMANYRETYDRHSKEYASRVKGYMLTNARTRAKKAGVPFAIELHDIVIPPFCPILGIPLAISRGKVSAGSPSLDRIRPDLGYVKGNIQVISFRANTLKSDATPAELRVVADFLDSI